MRSPESLSSKNEFIDFSDATHMLEGSICLSTLLHLNQRFVKRKMLRRNGRKMWEQTLEFRLGSSRLLPLF